MKKHIKNYIEAWNIGEQDTPMCEFNGCSRVINDVHHIKYASKGRDDSFPNLLGVCRQHHNDIHAGKYDEQYVRNMKKTPFNLN